MTGNDNRYGNQPLGKSVEEVEQEIGATQTPPDQAAPDAVVIPAPVVVGGTVGSGVAAVVNPAALVDDSGQAVTPETHRDTSET